MACSAGSSTSCRSFGPETMTASVPFTAPATPPLTGESTATILRVASSAAISCAARGPVVERSTNVLTFLPDAMPPSPSATCRTIAGVGRLTRTVSTAEATALGEVAAIAPRATNGCSAAARVSNTVREKPASSRRLAMGAPMLPRPMKPRSLFAMLAPRGLFLGVGFVFSEDFARYAERIDSGRHACVDRHLQQHLANFILGDAVAHRPTDVQLELVWAVERREHCQVQHAACFARQSFACPDCAPTV